MIASGPHAAVFVHASCLLLMLVLHLIIFAGEPAASGHDRV
jgi:hypothetical protein